MAYLEYTASSPGASCKLSVVGKGFESTNIALAFPTDVLENEINHFSAALVELQEKGGRPRVKRRLLACILAMSRVMKLDPAEISVDSGYAVAALQTRLWTVSRTSTLEAPQLPALNVHCQRDVARLRSSLNRLHCCCVFSVV